VDAVGKNLNRVPSYVSSTVFVLVAPMSVKSLETPP
jgi:hypothetical protein